MRFDILKDLKELIKYGYMIFSTGSENAVSNGTDICNCTHRIT